MSRSAGRREQVQPEETLYDKTDAEKIRYKSLEEAEKAKREFEADVLSLPNSDKNYAYVIRLESTTVDFKTGEEIEKEYSICQMSWGSSPSSPEPVIVRPNSIGRNSSHKGAVEKSENSSFVGRTSKTERPEKSQIETRTLYSSGPGKSQIETGTLYSSGPQKRPQIEARSLYSSGYGKSTQIETKTLYDITNAGEIKYKSIEEAVIAKLLYQTNVQSLSNSDRSYEYHIEYSISQVCRFQPQPPQNPVEPNSSVCHTPLNETVNSMKQLNIVHNQQDVKKKDLVPVKKSEAGPLQPIPYDWNKTYKTLEQAQRAKRAYEAYDLKYPPPSNEQYEYLIHPNQALMDQKTGLEIERKYQILQREFLRSEPQIPQIPYDSDKIYTSLEEAEEAKRSFEAYDLAYPPKNEEYEYHITQSGSQLEEKTGLWAFCYRILQSARMLQIVPDEEAKFSGIVEINNTDNISPIVIKEEIVPVEKYHPYDRNKIYETLDEAEEAKCYFEAHDSAYPPQKMEYTYHINQMDSQVDEKTGVCTARYQITQLGFMLPTTPVMEVSRSIMSTSSRMETQMETQMETKMGARDTLSSFEVNEAKISASNVVLDLTNPYEK